MQPLDFNVIRRAQNAAKRTEKLNKFIGDRGIDLNAFKRDPDRYADVIKAYSEQCINESLFEEGREILDREFDKLCEYQKFHGEGLTNQFYSIAREILLSADDL